MLLDLLDDLNTDLDVPELATQSSSSSQANVDSLQLLSLPPPSIGLERDYEPLTNLTSPTTLLDISALPSSDDAGSVYAL